MNKAKEGEVNATDVGRHFLTKYYNAIVHDVEQVIHFYSDASNVKRFGKPTVTGIENIKTELNKNRLDSVNVRIFSTVCLNSLNDSIIIQVSGEFVQKAGDTRAFIQNVVLASQGPGKYYIYNDMIEWLSDLYPNLGMQQLNLSEPPPSSHYEDTLLEKLKEEQPVGGKQLPQNGQYQPPHHSAFSESSGHQGAHVRNIQSFIDQAAAASKQEMPKPEHLHEMPPQQFTKPPPTQEHAAPKAEQPTSSIPPMSQQPPPSLQHAQVPEESGPRTWAKLVSGQIKSNGLPPPTQPPPATVEAFTTMDKKIKTQQEFQQGRGERREGYKRDGNFKRGGGDRAERGERGEREEGQQRDGGNRPYRQRRGGGRGGASGEGNNTNGRQFRNDNEGNKREGGGGKRGQNAGERPFRRDNQQQAKAST